MSLPLGSIQRNQPLQIQAYQALKNAILSGDLSPDERLVETQLAAKLQVSRTPIREALRLLQHENLVTLGANGALYVVSLSQEDAEQLYDCRIALEQQSTREACQQATPDQLQHLDQILVQSKTLVESKPTQLTAFQMLDLDYQFHRLIAQSSGNLWLALLLDQVFDKMQLLRIQTIKHNTNVLEICVEHRRIYDAIVARNPEIAAQTMQMHLLASKRRVVQEIQQFQGRAKRS
ncbi:MAG: GntR family transcriptional regulator [Thermosynechococcaceae cyanobacterium]